MKARKGTILLQTLIGITTVCSVALGYTDYSSISKSNINTYVTDQNTVQPNTYQEISNSNALLLLQAWSNAECSATLQGNNILIPFPQTLPTSKTICEGSMTASSPMKSFRAEARFTFTPNPNAIQNSPTYETDELSIWAGQPEIGYFCDIEWGIVARIYDGNIYMFLQIGDGNRTLQFRQELLHEVDGELHTYACTLRSTGIGQTNNITLQCTVDDDTPVFINLISSNLTTPTSWGLVAKSMRVSLPSTPIEASLLVTKLEYSP